MLESLIKHHQLVFFVAFVDHSRFEVICKNSLAVEVCILTFCDTRSERRSADVQNAYQRFEARWSH